MTTTALIRDFWQNIAKPCQPHKLRPRLNFEGVWVIECPKGCSIHTAEDEPEKLISLYKKRPL